MPQLQSIVIYINLDKPQDKYISDTLRTISSKTGVPISKIVKNILMEYVNTLNNQKNKKMSVPGINTPYESECKKTETRTETTQVSMSGPVHQPEQNTEDSLLDIGF